MSKTAVTRTQPLAQRFQRCYTLPMSMPPTYHFQDLGTQAQSMAKNCGNERMAMVMQYVTLGSMIVMAGVAACHVLKEAFGSSDHDRGRSR